MNMKKDDLEFGYVREFTPLPDEFEQKSHITESRPQKKKAWMKKACLAAAAIVFAFMLYAGGDATAPVPPEGGDTVIAPTESDEPVNPMRDGTVYYTVYNCSFDESYQNRLLDEGSIEISSLNAGESYTLPQPVPVDGYEFVCWMVCGGGDPMPLSSGTIGALEISRRSPDENGDVRITVNAVWRPSRDGGMRCMLTLDANGGTINSSASETMNACGPFMSGSVIYPAAYGVPVRDGYRFTGWYSDAGCSGKPVTFLSASKFFGETNGETDWRTPVGITLYAGWEKE